MAEQTRAAVITTVGVILAAVITTIVAPIVIRRWNTAEAPVSPLAAVKGRVITQIRVGDPTALSERATAHLRENGIEIIATRPVDRDKSPSASEVRYYYDSDEALARRVAGLLAESGVAATPKDWSNYNKSRTPERGVVEVWFSVK